jgi:hypothetical protein
VMQRTTHNVQRDATHNVQRTTHNAQRDATHNAQRTTHNAQRDATHNVQRTTHNVQRTQPRFLLCALAAAVRRPPLNPKGKSDWPQSIAAHVGERLARAFVRMSANAHVRARACCVSYV